MVNKPPQTKIIATAYIVISVNRSSESPFVCPGARTITGLKGISSSSFAKIASFAIETVCLGFLCGAGILINARFYDENIN